jgi:hypothetical protein
MNMRGGNLLFFDRVGKPYSQVSSDLYNKMKVAPSTGTHGFSFVYILRSPECVRPGNSGVLKVGVSARDVSSQYNQRLGDYEKVWGSEFLVHYIKIFGSKQLAKNYESALKRRCSHLQANVANRSGRGDPEWFMVGDTDTILSIALDMGSEKYWDDPVSVRVLGEVGLARIPVPVTHRPPVLIDITPHGMASRSKTATSKKTLRSGRKVGP